MIEGIPADQVPEHWHRVAGRIEAALVRVGSLLTLDETRRRLLDRRMQLWLIDDLVVITEVYDTAAGMTCALPVVGGQGVASSLGAMAVLEAWARDQGCVRMTGEGRAGWERALKREGWTVISTQVEKRLG